MQLCIQCDFPNISIWVQKLIVKLHISHNHVIINFSIWPLSVVLKICTKFGVNLSGGYINTNVLHHLATILYKSQYTVTTHHPLLGSLQYHLLCNGGMIFFSFLIEYQWGFSTRLLYYFSSQHFLCFLTYVFKWKRIMRIILLIIIIKCVQLQKSRIKAMFCIGHLLASVGFDP